MIMAAAAPQRSAVRMKPLPRSRSAWTASAASPRIAPGPRPRLPRMPLSWIITRAAVVGTNASATAGA